MSKWARRRDVNEKAIVAALRAAGATVQQLDGSGVPDLVVGYNGQDCLLEVKQPGVDKPVRRTTRGAGHDDRGLGEKQQAWVDGWRGRPVAIVTTPAEALAAIGITPGAPL